MPMKKETQYHAWYWIAAMVAVMMIQMIFASYTQIARRSPTASSRTT